MCCHKKSDNNHGKFSGMRQSHLFVLRIGVFWQYQAQIWVIFTRSRGSERGENSARFDRSVKVGLANLFICLVVKKAFFGWFIWKREDEHPVEGVFGVAYEHFAYFEIVSEVAMVFFEKWGHAGAVFVVVFVVLNMQADEYFKAWLNSHREFYEGSSIGFVSDEPFFEPSYNS